MKPYENSLKEGVKAIRAAKSVMIAAHMNPDGDTIGCQLALGLTLMQMDRRVHLLCQDPMPTRYQFLQGSELVTSTLHDKVDLAIAVDCGSSKQLGSVREVFLKVKQTIQIDHHDFGEAFGKIQILEPDASAVGEIVFDLIEKLGAEITPAIASCLLTSIIIDTGSFRFSNVRAKTFDICSKLVKKGVDVQNLIEEAYWVKSRPMAMLSSHALTKAKFSNDGALAWTTVTQGHIMRLGAALHDADSVADDLRSIQGVKVAALFRETARGNYRISLRSKKGINVAAVAQRFGGGGHHYAAGCSIPSSQADVSKVLKALEGLVS